MVLLTRNLTKFLFCFVIIFTSISKSFSQITRVIYKNDYYNAEYESQELNKNCAKMSVSTAAIVKKAIDGFINQEFELLFNKNLAIYSKLNRLVDNSDGLNDEVNNEIYYKDLNFKEKFFQSNVTGSKFNIQVPFVQYNWTITNESKMITGYKCYKAKVIQVQFNPLNNLTVNLNRIAWFTPDIPSSFGPQGFDGLPGLVLETTENDKLCLHAVKIDFNYNKKNIKLEKPVCKKSISLLEYEFIEKANYKKMQDEMGN